MAEQGLRSVVVKKYNHHANQGSVPDDKVNILKRDFGTETVNPKFIGYAYGTSMTAELAVQAVKNARLNVRDTEGIILHSDMGSPQSNF